MAGPSIALYNSADSAIVSTWSVGTVQAQVASTVLTVNIWNNKGGSTAVSDLKDCSVTVLDSNGSTSDEDVAKNKWVQINVPSIDGNSTTYTAIGGATTKAIRANSGVSDNTIKGDTNNGVSANSGANVATVNFRIMAPINSDPGNKTFKIRLTGYYT